jgi:hypothetical protein
MDKLKPTTFQISTEDVKYSINSGSKVETITDATGGTTTNEIRTINRFTPKDGSLNLRAYVELSCFSTVCMNTIASVNSSQIGVNLIDKNDLGIEIGNCFVRFNHDDELRSF